MHEVQKKVFSKFKWFRDRPRERGFFRDQFSGDCWARIKKNPQMLCLSVPGHDIHCKQKERNKLWILSIDLNSSQFYVYQQDRTGRIKSGGRASGEERRGAGEGRRGAVAHSKTLKTGAGPGGSLPISRPSWRDGACRSKTVRRSGSNSARFSSDWHSFSDTQKNRRARLLLSVPLRRARGFRRAPRGSGRRPRTRPSRFTPRCFPDFKATWQLTRSV